MSDSTDKDIVQITQSYIQEANEARRNRLDLNTTNYDVYHMRQDFSHKKAGQSREFLAKQQMSVEQISSFIGQALADINDWFLVEDLPGSEDPAITTAQVESIISNQLDKVGVLAFVNDSMKLGLLGSLMICKVGGRFSKKNIFYTEQKLSLRGLKKVLKREEKEVWNLDLSLVRQQDYYPDPSGRGLYELQNIYIDYHELMKLSEGPNAIYDKSIVEILTADGDDELQKEHKARETKQNPTTDYYRKTIKLTEGWGTIVDRDGNVLHENCTWTVANDRFLIAKPESNPLWHGESPFVVCPIIRVPHSVWHRALMDAPTKHNIAMNEIYNLILDSGMMSTFGIKQLRTDWLEDIGQVSNGIYPGMTLEVNSNCPPGMKVVERVDTSSLSSESLSVYNLTNAEFQQSSLTNDLRMGILPARQVKATEVVEASQSITSVFTGVAKAIEQDYIQPVLRKAWMNIAQNIASMDSEELGAAIGREKAQQLQSMGPEELFAKTANNLSFKVFGVSRTLNKVKDFRKLTSLLQTISGSEVLVEEFIKKYDFGLLLEQIMKSLDINMDQIKLDEEAQALNQMQQEQAPVQGMPDLQSQIPQASSGALNDTVQSLIPRTDFPPSPVSGLRN
jgi:hypothetical protein